MEVSEVSDSFLDTLVDLENTSINPTMMQEIAQQLDGISSNTIKIAIQILNLSLGHRVCFACGAIAKGPYCPNERLGEFHNVISKHYERNPDHESSTDVI
jgi:hypothetical protein